MFMKTINLLVMLGLIAIAICLLFLFGNFSVFISAFVAFVFGLLLHLTLEFRTFKSALKKTKIYLEGELDLLNKSKIEFEKELKEGKFHIYSNYFSIRTLFEPTIQSCISGITEEKLLKNISEVILGIESLEGLLNRKNELALQLNRILKHGLEEESMLKLSEHSSIKKRLSEDFKDLPIRISSVKSLIENHLKKTTLIQFLEYIFKS